MKQTKSHTRIAKGLCALALAATGPAFGALVFDRGLPTANLNNAAGSDRSNVAWADVESSSTPPGYWLPGDDFTLSGSGTYAVSKISVWTVGAPTAGLTLMGGTGGSIALVSSSYDSTKVTYLGGSTYQGSSGSDIDLYQIDFNVNFNLAAGTLFEFFVDGWTPYGTDGSYRTNFLHASNKDKSSSTQEGADNIFKWYHVGGSGGPAVETWFSGTGGGTTGWGPGWDKNSDANVQVHASAVPEPETYTLALAGMVMVGLLGARRRRA